MRAAAGFLYENAVPHINLDEDKKVKTEQKVWEVFKTVVATIGLALSFVVFPELTVIGFCAGIFFSDPIRELASRIAGIWEKVNFPLKAIGFIGAGLQWPILILAVPYLLGSYISWQVFDRNASDPLNTTYLKNIRHAKAIEHAGFGSVRAERSGAATPLPTGRPRSRSHTIPFTLSDEFGEDTRGIDTRGID